MSIHYCYTPPPLAGSNVGHTKVSTVLCDYLALKAEMYKLTYLLLSQDLVSKLIVLDPKKRLTAKQALQHPWVQVITSLWTVHFEIRT